MTQSLNKFQIPVKTKIAVWWIRTVAVLLAIIAGFIFVLADGMRGDCGQTCLPLWGNSGYYEERCLPNSCSQSIFAALPTFSIIMFFIYFPAFLFSFGISKNKKWAWIFALAALLLPGVLLCSLLLVGIFYNFHDAFWIFLGLGLVFAIAAFLAPAILLLADRKNYLAAVEKAKNQAKNI